MSPPLLAINGLHAALARDPSAPIPLEDCVGLLELDAVEIDPSMAHEFAHNDHGSGPVVAPDILVGDAAAGTDAFGQPVPRRDRIARDTLYSRVAFDLWRLHTEKPEVIARGAHDGISVVHTGL